MSRRRSRACAAILAALLAGCGPTGDPTPPLLTRAEIIGCFGVEEAECSVVTDAVAAALPAERGVPTTMLVQLAECDPGTCGPGQISGQVTVEWADGGQPLLLRFDGPPDGPVFGLVKDVGWSGLLNPTSKRVAPGVVVPFTLGHCGLLHVVDFDGSFWVPVGVVHNDPVTINAADGQMQLIAPNRAQFASGGKLIATLARFPGPKHFWLCA